MVNQLGRYRLVRLLATGGMGEVYLARAVDDASAQPVVIKRMLRHLQRDLNVVERFTAEAQLAMRLNHPNVARVWSLERTGDERFMVQAYVHGLSLSELLRKTQASGLPGVPDGVAVKLMRQVLSALTALHELADANGRVQGFVHGDVSPDNMLVGFDGQARLVDFGIARAKGERTPLAGKVRYGAPEWLSGAVCDGRADVYSAGVVLRELVTGSVDGQLAPGLSTLVERATMPKPADRWGSARVFSEALQAWLEAAEPNTDVVALLEHTMGKGRVHAPVSLEEPKAAVISGRTVPLQAYVPEPVEEAPEAPPSTPVWRIVVGIAAALFIAGWLAVTPGSTQKPVTKRESPPVQAPTPPVPHVATPVPAPVSPPPAPTEPPTVVLKPIVVSGTLAFQLERGVSARLNGAPIPSGTVQRPPGAYTIVLRRGAKVKKHALSLAAGQRVFISWQKVRVE